jgi:hypothetical protein
MIRVRDFTRLPLGTNLGSGEIKVCEHCGRFGIAEVESGKTFFTHSETVGYDAESNPVLKWDMCPALFPKKALE